MRKNRQSKINLIFYLTICGLYIHLIKENVCAFINKKIYIFHFPYNKRVFHSDFIFYRKTIKENKRYLSVVL